MRTASGRIVILFAMALFLILEGCAMSPSSRRPRISLEAVPGGPGRGPIIHVDQRRTLSFEDLITRLRRADVVFLGEVHDNAEHHLIQTQVLQALMSTPGRYALGVEFLQRPHQQLLDQYVKGALSEKAFLDRLNWKQAWGFDYHLYRPLMQLAREKAARIVGLNAPREIVRKVARKGLEGLSAEDRRRVAREIDLQNEDHRAYVRRTFEFHPHGDLSSFEYFYQAQCTWDETMAETVAAYLTGDRRKMVVIAGNGHLAFRFGIPERVVRRIPLTTATLLPLPLQKGGEIQAGIADFVWLTRAGTRDPRAGAR